MLTVVLWGANPVAVRYSLERLPPITVSGYRFLLATLVMGVWCLAARSPLGLRRGQIVPMLICAVLLYLQIATFTIGVDWSNASHSSLIINNFVLGVVALEHFVTRAHRLSPRRGLGVAIAAAGVPLVFLAASGESADGEAPSVRGDLVLLASAALLAVKVVYTKRAVRRVPAATLIFWHNVVGTLMFFATAAAVEEVKPGPWGWSATLGIAYQGLLVAGLCFGIQAWLLTRHSSTQVSIFNFATPLVGVAAAVALRGDDLTVWLLVAGVMVATGIWLVSRE